MEMKYYVRVRISDKDLFEKYLEDNQISVGLLSNDIGPNGGVMYAINMDGDQALAMNLSFPLIGCLNFTKLMNKTRNT